MIEHREYQPVVFDNRRIEKPLPEWLEQYLFNLHPTLIKGPQEMLKITPESIKDILPFCRAGDGSAGFIMDLLLKAQSMGLIKEPVLAMLGQGTTNTLLNHQLINGHTVDIPDYLKGLFPASDFIAKEYYPLALSNALPSGQTHPGYLTGADLLTVNTQLAFNKLNWRSNPKFGYTAAGMLAARTVFSRMPHPQAQDPSYETADGQTSSLNKGQLHTVLLAAAISKIAAFDFSRQVNNRDIMILALSSEQPAELIAKYLLTLTLGTAFPHGPDKAVDWGLLKRIDAKKLTFTPDSSVNYDRPNLNVDGDLYHLDKEISVMRSQSPVMLLVPRWENNTQSH